MSRHRKQQTEAFKAEAVALVKASGKGVPEIAEELGINARTLYTWVASDKSSSAVTDEGNGRDLEAENRRLRRELEIMRQERDILKKAMSVFAKGS